MDRMEVRLDFGGEGFKVGSLIRDDRAIYFRCAQEYLDVRHDISPFKLRKTTAIQQVDTSVFDGLHGVFADSLPDGWGRLVLDRALSEKNIDLNAISPLDRLAYVGTNGMGALTYHPIIDGEGVPDTTVNLDAIADAAQRLLDGKDIDTVEDLVELGGSSGGARPKIVVAYHPQTHQLLPDAIELPAGFEHWLIKFPASADPAAVARTEYAYYLMARSAGLEMAPCRLFTGRSGRLYFGTKRFDRAGGKRIHLHSAAGLMHDNFRLSNMDYGNLMDAALRLENSVSAPAKILRLAAFNVFAHNRDDHGKNVSFLMDATGKWRLAPAYDLTFSRSSHGYHSLTVAGEGRQPSVKHLQELAADFSVADAPRIIDEVRTAVGNWMAYAEEAAVPTAARREVQKALTVK